MKLINEWNLTIHYEIHPTLFTFWQLGSFHQWKSTWSSLLVTKVMILLALKTFINVTNHEQLTYTWTLGNVMMTRQAQKTFHNKQKIVFDWIYLLGRMVNLLIFAPICSLGLPIRIHWNSSTFLLPDFPLIILFTKIFSRCDYIISFSLKSLQYSIWFQLFT